MSTGLNCEIIEAEPNQWYYVLEHSNAPKCAWNWHDHADAFGPFNTYESALDHLYDHHANPGAHWRVPHAEFRPSESMARLLAAARENLARNNRCHVGRQFGLPAGCVLRFDFGR